MKKTTIILVGFTLVSLTGAVLTATGQGMDPEAISQVSKGIAEWKLMRSAEKMLQKAPTVFASSSLAGVIADIGLKGSTLVFGLTAFDEWRPVQTAIDFYENQRQRTLASARPEDNWVWTGIKAAGWEVAGKYIQDFRPINALSIENNIVTLFDPGRKYNQWQKVSAGIGLSGDLASPFSATILKGSGGYLLQNETRNALTSADFNQLHSSTVFLAQGLGTYSTIKDVNFVYKVGSGALNLAQNAVGEFGAHGSRGQEWQGTDGWGLQGPSTSYTPYKWTSPPMLPTESVLGKYTSPILITDSYKPLPGSVFSDSGLGTGGLPGRGWSTSYGSYNWTSPQMLPTESVLGKYTSPILITDSYKPLRGSVFSDSGLGMGGLPSGTWGGSYGSYKYPSPSSLPSASVFDSYSWRAPKIETYHFTWPKTDFPSIGNSTGIPGGK
jgi:hypothetical protein